MLCADRRMSARWRIDRARLLSPRLERLDQPVRKAGERLVLALLLRERAGEQRVLVAAYARDECELAARDRPARHIPLFIHVIVAIAHAIDQRVERQVRSLGVLPGHAFAQSPTQRFELG